MACVVHSLVRINQLVRRVFVINRVILPIALYIAAIWLSIMIDDTVFNGFEVVFVSAVISFILGMLIYKRRDTSGFYLDSKDERSYFRRVSPISYACLGTIIVGLVTIHTSIGERFEVVAFISDKYERYNRGRHVYSLGVSHEKYGTVNLRVSEKVWLAQSKGAPMILSVQMNLVGLYIVNDFELIEN